MIYSGIAEEEPPAVDRGAIRSEFGFAPDAPSSSLPAAWPSRNASTTCSKALDLLQHVQPELRTLIAGEDRCDHNLRKTPGCTTCRRRVRFLGHRDDVPRLMAAATLVVLPSAYEGLPNIVLEAMRFRKPVVATSAPGTTEVVVDGQTGVLVPVANPQLLARAIRDVVRDPDLARRLGMAGREHVDAKFSVQIMIDQFARLYDELAQVKGLDVAR